MKKLDWSKDGFYDPNVGSFMMQFGIGTIKTDGKIQYTPKKKYYYVDKRTKKYGAQRAHDGKMGAYKSKSSPQL